jgi:hypothetical protein
MLNIFDIVILDIIVNAERRWQGSGPYYPPPARSPPKPRKPWSWLRLGTWIGVCVAAGAIAVHQGQPSANPTLNSVCGLVVIAVCLRLGLQFLLLLSDIAERNQAANEQLMRAFEARHEPLPWTPLWAYRLGANVKRRRKRQGKKEKA